MPWLLTTLIDRAWSAGKIKSIHFASLTFQVPGWIYQNFVIANITATSILHAFGLYMSALSIVSVTVDDYQAVLKQTTENARRHE